MSVVLPRPGAKVLQENGSFDRIWYKALEDATKNINGLVSGQTIYTDTGTVDAMVINSGISAYTRGLVRYVVPAYTNDSVNVTLADSGLTPQIVQFPDGTFPAVGAIVAGQTLEVIYNGAQWEIQNLQATNQVINGDLAVAGNLSVTGTSQFTGQVNSTAAIVAGTSLQATTAVIAGTYVQMQIVAVGSLPAAGSYAGARFIVNNATATTYNSIVAAGGANIVPVFSDGTNWRIG